MHTDREEIQFAGIKHAQRKITGKKIAAKLTMSTLLSSEFEISIPFHPKTDCVVVEMCCFAMVLTAARLASCLSALPLKPYINLLLASWRNFEKGRKNFHMYWDRKEYI